MGISSNYVATSTQIGFGIWELISEYTVSGGAVAGFDFTVTLDGDNDGGYMMEYQIINAGGAPQIYDLRINAATWAVQRQWGLFNNAAVSAGRDTNPDFCDVLVASSPVGGSVMIPNSKSGLSGRLAFATMVKDLGTMQMAHFGYFITTPSAATNITSLGVEARFGGAQIGNGSSFRLYRRIRKK